MWKQVALGLIKQLPKDHEGRNTFIMNHSNCEEARNFKVKHILSNTATSLDEKVKLIEGVYYQSDRCDKPMKKPPQMPQYNGPEDDEW